MCPLATWDHGATNMSKDSHFWHAVCHAPGITTCWNLLIRKRVKGISGMPLQHKDDLLVMHMHCAKSWPCKAQMQSELTGKCTSMRRSEQWSSKVCVAEACSQIHAPTPHRVHAVQLLQMCAWPKLHRHARALLPHFDGVEAQTGFCSANAAGSSAVPTRICFTCSSDKSCSRKSASMLLEPVRLWSWNWAKALPLACDAPSISAFVFWMYSRTPWRTGSFASAWKQIAQKSVDSSRWSKSLDRW